MRRPAITATADDGQFRAVVELSLQAIMVFDRDGRPLFANQAAADMFGYGSAEALMRLDGLARLTVPEERAPLDAVAKLLSGADETATLAWRGRREDGSTIWLETRARVIDWQGQAAVLAAIVDVTAHKATERELEARDAFSRLLSDLSAKFVNLAPDSVIAEIEHGLEQVCRALAVDRCCFYECAEDGRSLLLVQAFGLNGDTSHVPRNLTQDLPWFAQRLLDGRLMVTKGPLELPEAALPERRYSERHRIRSSVAIPISVGGSRLCAFVATSVETRQAWPDVVVEQLRLLGQIFASALARKRSDEARRSSEDRFRDLAAVSADWYWETDEALRLAYVSERLAQLTGRRRDDLVGREVWALMGDDASAPPGRQLVDALREHQTFRELHFVIPTEAGDRHCSLSGKPVFDGGRFRGYRGTGVDITGEMEARVQLSDAIDSMSDGVVICDREERIVLCNHAFRELNAPIAEHLKPGLAFADFLRLAADDGIVVGAAERRDEWVRGRLEGLRSGTNLEEYQFYDGRWIQLVDRRTENGYTVGLCTDITEAKQREEQLRQAQKMEAIGQLTGGIAHDFNNLLAIIQGNLSYLERQIDEDSPLLKLTEPALRATRRGAALTHRLLAFSRRQPLEDRVIDASELLRGMQDLLHRSLGEQVTLEIVCQPGLWSCLIDPVQLEHALLNLAINARDAMPGGGRLLIEVSNAELSDRYAAAQAEVRPGAYVAIAVSDTGEGMTAEVKARIFEPFFTTKETGHGTGLGLSMVFGFVKQSNGHITVYSEPGFGCTFKLYLPRSDGNVAPSASADD